jgi:hypothetical protein
MRSYVPSSRRAAWLDAATLIGIVGAGLQIHQWAGARPLWLDEEMIAVNLRDRTFAELTGTLWLGQSAPIGWLFVQRAVLLTLGTSELALRLVPVLFGIATVATAVWVGRRWMRPIAAAVFVLLCSVAQWISFYYLELKQYSADTFCGLLLPALALWALEPEEDGRTRTRRMVTWWLAAAVGQWFSNGALLVAPACVLVMIAVLLHRNGWRAASQFAVLGLIWLVSFGLNYALALRHNLSNKYLQDYWAFAMAPASEGALGRLQWLAAQMGPFASKPGGTELWILFWLVAAGGILLTARSRPAFAVLFAAVPFSAFSLAGLRIVPLHERLSLWVVPALYVAVALFVDGVERLWLAGSRRRNWIRSGVAMVLGIMAFVLCFDILNRGKDDFLISRPRQTNHGVDDRSAVRWLMARRQPGDVLVAPHLSLPALWWYGGVPISDPGAGTRLPDGNPVIKVEHHWPGPRCELSELREVLQNHPRVALYLGFRFDEWPKEFDEWLLETLTELGTITADKSFAGASRATIVDLRMPGKAAYPARHDPAFAQPPRPNGCLTAGPSQRW